MVPIRMLTKDLKKFNQSSLELNKSVTKITSKDKDSTFILSKTREFY